MNEPNESDLANQDVGPPSKRRLSILDLMLAMVAFALAMGLHQNLQSMQTSLTMQLTLFPNDPFWGKVFYSNFVVFTGLTFCGIMLVVRSRLNAAKRSVLHPGHLMLIMQFSAIAVIVTSMIFAWFTGEEDAMSNLTNRTSVYLPAITIQLIGFFIALVGALTWRWSWSWVTTWVLLTLSSSLILGVYCIIFAVENSILPQEYYSYLGTTNVVSFSLSFLVVVFVVIAMINDLRKGTPRDAAHWIGIVCWFGLSICHALLVIIALQFADPAEIFGNVGY